jgi:hypothetical protein
MRNSRREAARFGEAARELSRESAALEKRLAVVNRELSLARDFIAASRATSNRSAASPASGCPSTPTGCRASSATTARKSRRSAASAPPRSRTWTGCATTCR